MENITNTDDKFLNLIHKYFRRSDTALNESELNKFSRFSPAERMEYIKQCEYPEVLDKLFRISEREIQMVIQRTDYYNEIGQFKDILQFNKEERIQFAAFDTHKNVYCLILFDTDIEVLKAAVYNPSIDIQILQEISKILLRRKQSQVDEVFIRLIENAIEHKQKINKKSSKIENDTKDLSDPNKLANILCHLLDDDKEVIRFTLF